MPDHDETPKGQNKEKPKLRLRRELKEPVSTPLIIRGRQAGLSTAYGIGAGEIPRGMNGLSSAFGVDDRRNPISHVNVSVVPREDYGVRIPHWSENPEYHQGGVVPPGGQRESILREIRDALPTLPGNDTPEQHEYRSELIESANRLTGRTQADNLTLTTNSSTPRIEQGGAPNELMMYNDGGEPAAYIEVNLPNLCTWRFASLSDGDYFILLGDDPIYYEMRSQILYRKISDQAVLVAVTPGAIPSTVIIGDMTRVLHVISASWVWRHKTTARMLTNGKRVKEKGLWVKLKRRLRRALFAMVDAMD